MRRLLHEHGFTFRESEASYPPPALNVQPITSVPMALGTDLAPSSGDASKRPRPAEDAADPSAPHGKKKKHAADDQGKGKGKEKKKEKSSRKEKGKGIAFDQGRTIASDPPLGPPSNEGRVFLLSYVSSFSLHIWHDLSYLLSAGSINGNKC